MIVLGITNNDQAGACLVSGEQIVAAASEERFSRKKDDQAWPSQAIAHVLQTGGIQLVQVDFVAYGWNAGFNADKHLPLYFDRIVYEARRNPGGLAFFRQRILDEIHNDKAKHQEFTAFLEQHHLADKAIYIDHHECHALGAFVCSPFDSALVVTCDGRGDYQSLTVSHYSPKGCKVLQRETTIDSLGYFYGRITHLLGYKPNRHEGKITGLAARGKPEKLLPLMQRMIDIEDGRLRARCGNHYLPSYHGYSQSLKTLLADEHPEDIAAAAQRHIENLLATLVQQHITAPVHENVCLAGGVFSNVKLNQRIRELPGVRNVYVLPCMGDGGLALAAAVGAVYQRQGTRYRAPSMLLGPEGGSLQENLALLARDYPDLACHQPDDITAVLIQALQYNQVLGMFKGRMEFGPRALCNRSILYHTADKTVNDWLNKRMHRTEFMPFAPVTALEHAAECYVGWQADHIAADYMTMAYDCTDDFIARCPAVVHVDGTARPQIVRPDVDPFMHRLLLAWHRESGQPALINTSFNKHEEPIVRSAHEALEALRDGMIDLLVMNEQLVVWKKGLNDFVKRRL